MTKQAKIFIIILSIVTVLAVCAGLYIHLGRGGFSYSKELVAETKELNESISSLNIDLDAADISVEYGDRAYVSYNLPKSAVPTIQVQDGTLTVKNHSNNRFDLSLLSQKGSENSVKIVLPGGTELTDVKVALDAGNISLNEINGDNFHINEDAGNIVLNNLHATNLSLDTDAGNVTLTDGEMDTCKADLDAGNLDLIRVHIKNVDFDMDAGNVTGNECSLEDGKIDSNLGNIKLNGTIGSVKATTDLGKVQINGSND